MTFEELRNKVRELQNREIKEEDFHRHSNGGGWVENTADVEESARVEANAIILNRARISWDAKVLGCACVSGNAEVRGDAIVSENAKVFGDAEVLGDAEVSANASVFGNAKLNGGSVVRGDAVVYGNARVFENACVFGNAGVYGNAKILGGACVSGNAEVFGNAVVYGDAVVNGNMQLGANILEKPIFPHGKTAEVAAAGSIDQKSHIENKNNNMALENKSFKRNIEIDAQLNQFIENNDRLVNYVKDLPREELERKYLLGKMKEDKWQKDYEKKVAEYINRPENAEFKESLMKSLSSDIKDDVTRERALLKEAKVQIHKQGIKMSM